VRTTQVTESPEGIRLLVKGSCARDDAPDQTLLGEHTVFISTNGSIQVSYAYKPVNCQGSFLEAGMSFLAPAAASELFWIGQGPYAGYPGKDRLNDFGIYHLNGRDIRFQGNRRQVDLAMLTRPSGCGLAVTGDKLDIAVENRADGILMSHNAKLSGRGNKGGGPETSIDAADPAGLTGSFSLFIVPEPWPAAVKAWFGQPGVASDVLHPFYHSYDQ
jgi:beta-galactosidase